MRRKKQQHVVRGGTQRVVLNLARMDRIVEIDVKDRGPTFEFSAMGGMEDMDINLKDVLPGLFGGQV